MKPEEPNAPVVLTAQEATPYVTPRDSAHEPTDSPSGEIEDVESSCDLIAARIAELRGTLTHSIAQGLALDEVKATAQHALWARLNQRIKILTESLRLFRPLDPIPSAQGTEVGKEHKQAEATGKRFRLDGTVPRLDPKAHSIQYMARTVETYSHARAIAQEHFGRVLLAAISWDQATADIVTPWVAEIPSLSWQDFIKRLEETFSPVTYLDNKTFAFIHAIQKKGETIQQFVAKFRQTSKELDFADDDSLLIGLFKSNLLDPYRRCLTSSLLFGGESAARARKSLTLMCDTAIQSSALLSVEEMEWLGLTVDTTDPSTALASPHSAASSPKSPTSTISESPEDPCPLHPYDAHTALNCLSSLSLAHSP